MLMGCGVLLLPLRLHNRKCEGIAVSKVKIAFELDFCEDYDEAERIIKYRELYNVVYDAYHVARSRLKHGEGVSDAESEVLDEIMSLLGAYV